MATVAVIGASNNHAKYGNKAVRAYLRQGWTVFPVNPGERTVEGLATFPDVQSIPQQVDRAALYVPATVGITLLPAIAGKGIRELFVNPGAESDELLAEAERLKLNVIQACAIVDIGERP
ncbi:MAG: CoA-binding protein [Pseudomonadota bacterium]